MTGRTRDEVWRAKWKGENAQILRIWRDETAKRNKLPAWHIMTNETLFLVAAAEPTNKEELVLAGMKPAAIRVHGDALLELIKLIKAEKAKPKEGPATVAAPAPATEEAPVGPKEWDDE